MKDFGQSFETTFSSLYIILTNTVSFLKFTVKQKEERKCNRKQVDGSKLWKPRLIARAEEEKLEKQN